MIHTHTHTYTHTHTHARTHARTYTYTYYRSITPQPALGLHYFHFVFKRQNGIMNYITNTSKEYKTTNKIKKANPWITLTAIKAIKNVIIKKPQF